MTSTVRMAFVPVLFTVTVNTWPALSPTNWLLGVIDAVAANSAADAPEAKLRPNTTANATNVACAKRWRRPPIPIRSTPTLPPSARG